MKRPLKSLLLTLSATLALTAQTSPNLADLPDPLVGTDSRFELSRGNTYPGVFLPFAMLAWTPQTGEGGWPYQYSATTIRGFRATHRPSAWTFDYGPFSFMPVTGELKVLPEQRASRFQHRNEDARAYRYSVLFDDGVRAEMAPSVRGGILRFTFPKTGPAFLVLDAQPGGSGVRIQPESNRITGTNHSVHGKSPKFAHYFVAVFDRKFKSQGTWDGAGATDTAMERSGKHVGGYVEFEPGETVSVRVGTSLISLEQAERNLNAEIPAADFEKIAARAREVWNRELAKIEVRGGTEAERRTFYTALYHAFQFPHMLQEVDAAGKTVHYSPYDDQIHPGPMMADNGFWDTFRAQFPLLTLVQPKKDAEIIRAMLNAYDESGWLPKWPNPDETNIMIGTHADSVIADAYMKGIRDYDVAKAYEAIRKDATQPGTGKSTARPGIEDYIRLGYVPADKVKESAACTLEYAYNDFCVAQVARALGKMEDYRLFSERSKNYRNLYDPATGFMRGRNSDGKWVEPFDPLAWGGVYTEGNAWQWLWSVQQDVAGFTELLGGKDALVKKLDELFSMTTDFKVGGYGKVIHEMTEAKMTGMGQYAHVNEPVHHVIYLYNYAGQPWKAQKWARAVMDDLYKPGPSGWLGDEDTGQTSSWYIFSAMGFYPVNPGQPVYALGSPLFDSATVRLENGKSFTIKADRKGPAELYVQSASLNGKPLNRCWITHSEILAGGTLAFRMGPQPNTAWGTSGIPPAADANLTGSTK